MRPLSFQTPIAIAWGCKLFRGLGLGGGVLVMFRCLGQSYLGGVSVMFWWCLAHFEVVCCFYGSVFVLFWWCTYLFCFVGCLAYVEVVSRSPSLCVCQLCACVSIHLVHIVCWCLNIILLVNVKSIPQHGRNCFA